MSMLAYIYTNDGILYSDTIDFALVLTHSESEVADLDVLQHQH